MKKINLLLLLVISTLIFTGCAEEKKKELKTDISKDIKIDDTGASLVCTTDHDYTELNYVIGSKYVVFAEENNKVTKIISKEIIESTDQTILDDFERYLNENHNAALQYGGYTYDIKREDDKITSSVNIDYNEFDIAKFAKENESVEQDITVMTVDELEKQYISLGAECKRK